MSIPRPLIQRFAASLLVAAMAMPMAAIAAQAFAPRDPVTIATEVAEFVRATTASESWMRLRQYRQLNITVQAVQRQAQVVIAADDRDLANAPARNLALLNALRESALTAEGIVLRPGTTPSDIPALVQLDKGMRARSEELATVLPPRPVATSLDVSTPQRRLAIVALYLAQTVRTDNAFLAPGRHPTLVTSLDSIERAAHALLAGKDADRGTDAALLQTLSTAIQATVTVADGIVQRSNENMENRQKAAELARSLRLVAVELGMTR